MVRLISPLARPDGRTRIHRHPSGATLLGSSPPILAKDLPAVMGFHTVSRFLFTTPNRRRQLPRSGGYGDRVPQRGRRAVWAGQLRSRAGCRPGCSGESTRQTVGMSAGRPTNVISRTLPVLGSRRGWHAQGRVTAAAAGVPQPYLRATAVARLRVVRGRSRACPLCCGISVTAARDQSKSGTSRPARAASPSVSSCSATENPRRGRAPRFSGESDRPCPLAMHQARYPTPRLGYRLPSGIEHRSLGAFAHLVQSAHVVSKSSRCTQTSRLCRDGDSGSRTANLCRLIDDHEAPLFHIGDSSVQDLVVVDFCIIY